MRFIILLVSLFASTTVLAQSEPLCEIKFYAQPGVDVHVSNQNVHCTRHQNYDNTSLGEAKAIMYSSSNYVETYTIKAGESIATYVPNDKLNQALYQLDIIPDSNGRYIVHKGFRFAKTLSGDYVRLKPIFIR